MAQYARPDGSVETLSNWSGAYTTIDESSYSDADYITGSESANGTAEEGLSNVTDPTVHTGHTVRFRAWQENATHQRTLLVQLLQGATVISAYNSGSAFNLVKGTQTAYNWTLSEAEAANITDYNDLRIKFTSGGTVSTPAASRSYVYVSWAELETPDAPDTVDDLTALDVAFGTPVLETLTIGQKHVLISVDSLSGTPALELATLGQKHVLTALDIVSGVPVIEQATAGEGSSTDELTALDIVSGTPVIEQAAIGQIHALTSSDLVSGTPAIEQSEIGQVHVLTSQDVSSGVPVIEQSTIGQVHILASQDVDSGTPVIEQSTIGQIHVLTSQDLTSGTPVIETPTAGEPTPGEDALTSLDITSGTPVIEQSTIGQIHGLTLADLLFGTPELEQATIAQVHALLSSDILAGTPEIETATLGLSEAGVDDLTAQDITFGVPIITIASLKSIDKRGWNRYKKHSARFIKQRHSHSTIYPDGSFDDNYHIRNR